MEQDKGPRDLRMRDPRPWVGVGASRHDSQPTGIPVSILLFVD